MAVVQVDVVGAQASQGFRAALADRVAGQAPESRESADLGRDDHRPAIAPRLHPGADDLLGLATDMSRCPGRVGICRVDEVAAHVRVRIQDVERRRTVGGPAEDVAAQADREDVEVGAANAIHALNLGGEGALGVGAVGPVPF